MFRTKLKMAGLVDYAADSGSEEETENAVNEELQLHLKGTSRSIEDMKSNMKLNIRPEVTSKVTFHHILGSN